jgi:hypothetical protein
LIDDDDFARLDVAHKLRVNQIQRAGFAGDHPGAVNLAEAQRAEAMLDRARRSIRSPS